MKSGWRRRYLEATLAGVVGNLMAMVDVSLFLATYYVIHELGIDRTLALFIAATFRIFAHLDTQLLKDK